MTYPLYLQIFSYQIHIALNLSSQFLMQGALGLQALKHLHQKLR